MLTKYRKVKTDRIDAMQIALYGLAYWQELQPTRLPEDTYRELQLLARQYYQMTSLTPSVTRFCPVCRSS